ncbi:hypothetical protein P7K49_024797 [Saguinus oedipus]|uniref:Homeobox domain-containing protein n=1 Tax=Saguinus oedipus TaxID=9490 RepID=A0ABQ9UQI2_SAGOE|nr:hypothetical protein P7K49_024797 [Saguinus oedipus]
MASYLGGSEGAAQVEVVAGELGNWEGLHAELGVGGLNGAQKGAQTPGAPEIRNGERPHRHGLCSHVAGPPPVPQGWGPAPGAPSEPALWPKASGPRRPWPGHSADPGVSGDEVGRGLGRLPGPHPAFFTPGRPAPASLPLRARGPNWAAAACSVPRPLAWDTAPTSRAPPSFSAGEAREAAWGVTGGRGLRVYWIPPGGVGAEAASSGPGSGSGRFTGPGLRRNPAWLRGPDLRPLPTPAAGDAGRTPSPNPGDAVAQSGGGSGRGRVPPYGAGDRGRRRHCAPVLRDRRGAQNADAVGAVTAVTVPSSVAVPALATVETARLGGNAPVAQPSGVASPSSSGWASTPEELGGGWSGRVHRARGPSRHSRPARRSAGPSAVSFPRTPPRVLRGRTAWTRRTRALADLKPARAQVSGLDTRSSVPRRGEWEWDPLPGLRPRPAWWGLGEMKGIRGSRTLAAPVTSPAAPPLPQTSRSRGGVNGLLSVQANRAPAPSSWAYKWRSPWCLPRLASPAWPSPPAHVAALRLSSSSPRGPQQPSSFGSVDWLSQSSCPGPTHSLRPANLPGGPPWSGPGIRYPGAASGHQHGGGWRTVAGRGKDPGGCIPPRACGVSSRTGQGLACALTGEPNPWRAPRVRTAFSTEQVHTLEGVFRHHQFLGPLERKRLAREMQLSEVQVRWAGQTGVGKGEPVASSHPCCHLGFPAGKNVVSESPDEAQDAQLNSPFSGSLHVPLARLASGLQLLCPWAPLPGPQAPSEVSAKWNKRPWPLPGLPAAGSPWHTTPQAQDVVCKLRGQPCPWSPGACVLCLRWGMRFEEVPPTPHLTHTVCAACTWHLPGGQGCSVYIVAAPLTLSHAKVLENIKATSSLKDFKRVSLGSK